MEFLEARKTTILRRSLVVAMAVTSLGVFGCNSGHAPKTMDTEQVALPAKNGVGPDIDLNCVIDHIQNPPESFHYAFKDESSNRWEEEADVTPQKIDGSFLNNSLPNPQEFHGTPREVWSNLRAIGRLASAMAIVHGSSAIVREGPEKVNGYDTVKYSIDTARGDATEQGLYVSVLGKGGAEKGTVWVTAQGCPAQLVLDEDLRAKDGSPLGKAHYEEAMIRK